MEEEREVEGEIDIVAVRMECLNLAVQAQQHGSYGAIDLTKKMFEFVTSNLTIVPIEEPQKPDQSTEH